MIQGSIDKLAALRHTTDDVAYLRQVKACVGAIGRIPNGMLKGHVNRDHLTEAVNKLLGELEHRISRNGATGHESC